MKNYIEILKKIELDIFNNLNSEEIRIKLKNILDELVPIKEPNEKILSIISFTEIYLFNNIYNKDNEYKIYKEPVSSIYYLLALTYLNDKNYLDAAKEFKNAISWNPYDATSYFQLVEIYMKENDYEKMKVVLFEMHKFIYFYEDLGQFYKYLGNYLFLVKNYEAAGLCYSYATYFITDTDVDTMLIKIAGEVKKPVQKYDKKTCMEQLEKLKIPTNVDLNVLIKLDEVYTHYKETPGQYKLYRFLKRDLYFLTDNEKYEDTRTIRNTYYDFSFEIPEKWDLIDKTEYNKTSTGSYSLYVINIGNANLINFDVLKDVKSGLIDEYKNFRTFISNKGFVVKLENEMQAKTFKYVLSITQRKLLNEYLTMINCVFILNDKLFNISMPSFKNYNDENIKDIFRDNNAIRINNIINSINTQK